MNNDGRCYLIVIVVVFFVIGLISGFFAGRDLGRYYEHQKAIDAEVGRWEIDGTTGEKTFRYGK